MVRSHTPSESRVLGNAIKIGSCREPFTRPEASTPDSKFGTSSRISVHTPNAQKLSALISSMCKIQGCALFDWESSTGSDLSSEISSVSISCQIISLLSRPCLGS